jgi:hypothetical protein
MARGDIVNVIPGHTPDDYHCDCSFCRKVIGELRPADGSYYSRLERRQYYDPREGQSNSGMAHIAKTPLHIARWAVQAYTNPGDWVLDPTIGAGTTAVESITQGRSAAGMELEFTPILKENVARALSRAPDGVTAHVAEGDARNISDILADIPAPTLVINNPPYSGDVSMPSPGPRGRGKEFRDEEITYQYNTDLPNLAFLKEGPEYWRTMGDIYSKCIEKLAPGGHFVTGIKDMMRNKKPFLLHLDFCRLLDELALDYVGTAFLKHYPTTLFMNTYKKHHGGGVINPVFYQTINVFRKPK